MRLINADELRDIYSGVPNGVYTTSHFITAIDERETVDAVPLDKLCELMAETNVVVPCKICEYCDTYDCEIFPCQSTAEDWRNALTKWMEGAKRG